MSSAASASPPAGVLRCTSCGAVLPAPGGTQFLCPQCGAEWIGRHARCRDQSVVYHCPRCGFEGP